MGPAKSSGLKSASATIVTGPAKLRGLLVEADGTNAAVATVFDNTAGSGTELMKITVDATLTGDAVIFEAGISAETGLHLVLSGTGAKAIVLYDKC